MKTLNTSLCILQFYYFVCILFLQCWKDNLIHIEINPLSNMCYNLLVFHLDEIHKNVKPDDNVDCHGWTLTRNIQTFRYRHDTSHGMKTCSVGIHGYLDWHIYPEQVCAHSITRYRYNSHIIVQSRDYSKIWSLSPTANRALFVGLQWHCGISFIVYICSHNRDDNLTTEGSIFWYLLCKSGFSAEKYWWWLKCILTKHF